MEHPVRQSTIKQVPCDVAIVGMASHFPDATDLHEFWSNIVAKKDSIRDIGTVDPVEYWKREDYFDSDPRAADKVYGHKAGFVPPIDFDPLEFKLPPSMVQSISTVQLFSLYVAKQAMADAGLLGAQADKISRDRIGVILGGSGNGNTAFSLAMRQQIPFVRSTLVNSGLSTEVADDIIERVKGLFLEWDEDSFPGFLGNVACGRIASFFDLGGTSYMVDAACASSLAAIKAAICELADGSCDAVITGGVNMENSVFSFLCFSKTPALSKSGRSRPFDDGSDGMMLGDGVGLLVLKRLADAERDGDRIYAVIRALSASSDGRAKSIFAPRSEGQVKALRRAYEQAGISPADIQLIEAHGTGTEQGDETEIKSLLRLFGEHAIEDRSIAIGSIKSQIGHTRCAAGAAAMIKVALGLHHKVLPPTINVDKPARFLSGPLHVNTDARPWLPPSGGRPRRAALSAFGFGGTNYHAIVEEYGRDTPQGPYRLNQTPQVLALHADTPSALIATCESALSALRGDDAVAWFDAHVRDPRHLAPPPEAARLAFVATTAEHAAELLEQALTLLRKQADAEWEHPLGLYYKPRAASVTGAVVALFPGQGAQYVGMGRGVAVDFPELRRSLEQADQVAADAGLAPLSRTIYPPPAFTEQDRSEQTARLIATANAQPAIGAVSAGYFRILGDLGFVPDMCAGHSYGEVTALWAAGVLDDVDFHRVSLARGQAVGGPSGLSDAGAMLAAQLRPEQTRALLAAVDGIVVANHNSPEQVVLGGSADAIERALTWLRAHELRGQILPVSAAFHTAFVAHAAAPFDAALADIGFSAPRCALYSSASGDRHHVRGDGFRRALVDQLTEPVRFSQMIEKMHQDGGRVFVEIGPRGILSKLVAEILKDKPHVVIAVNPSASGDDATQLRKALARLVVEGVPLRATDHHALARTLLKTKPRSTALRLEGGFYLSEKNRRRRQHAMRVDTAVLDRFVAQRPVAPREKPAPQASWMPQSRPSAAAYTPPTRRSSKDMDGKKLAMASEFEGNVLDHQIHAQNLLSEVHQQFQANQKDYIQLLDALMSRQHALLDKFHGHQQMDQVVASLSHSLQLLERNQELYHLNHERYFDNQQVLVGAGGAGSSSVAARVVSAQVTNARAELPRLAITSTAPTPAPRAPRAVAPLPTAAAAVNVAPQASAIAHPPTAVVQPVLAPRPVLPTVPAREAAPAPIAAAAPEVARASVDQAKIDQAKIDQFARISEDALVKDLVAIVSDRTGYPTDMITDQMDLEADLGIDSIKRLEIFGAMSDKLSSHHNFFRDTEKDRDADNFDIEAFSNIRKMAKFFHQSLAELIAQLTGQVAAAPAPAATAPAPAAVVATPTPTQAAPSPESAQVAPLRKLGVTTSTKRLGDAPLEAAVAKKARAEQAPVQAPAQRDAVFEPVTSALPELYRQEVIAESLPPPDQTSLALPADRIWLIVDDGQGLADEVGARLKAEGQKIARLRWPVAARADQKTADGDGNDAGEWERRIDAIERAQGKIGGLVCLQPAREVDSLDHAFVPADYAAMRDLFALTGVLQARLCDGAGRACCFVVSQLDGHLGTAAGTPFAVVGAGLAGLAKSLHAEWEGVFSRAVDLDPRLSKAEAADYLIEELKDPRTDLTEVGRDINGTRMTLAARRATSSRGEVAIHADSVLLVTGGARGITADCVLALARRYPARFALLGRTDLDAPPPSWARDVHGDNALKAAAIAQLQAQGEQPTPVKVERMLDAVRNTGVIRQNLARIEQTGAKAAYYACDITDAADVARVVAKARAELGPVTGIVHGAGNLADKRIEKKSDGDFRGVFLTKVQGLDHLLRAVDPRAIEHLILFSSVSGFYGNAGQTDYAMANEVLNKFAHLFQARHPKALVRSIGWGPWDSGMVNDTLKKAYAARGLAIIPGEVGARHFVEEFQHGGGPQVLIGGGSYKSTRSLKPLTRAPELVEREVSLLDSPFLADHVLDDRLVLPATAAAGWLVKLAEDLLPGYAFESLHDFRVLKGLVLGADERGVLKARITPVALSSVGVAQGDRHALNIVVHGQHGGEKQNRYRGTVVLSREASSRPRFSDFDLKPGERLRLPLYGKPSDDPLLFHGPSLRGIREFINGDQHRLTLACALDPVPVSTQGRFRVSSFNPYLGDVFVQAPWVWLMLFTDRAGLPSAIGRFEQFAEIAFGQPFHLSMSVKSHSQATLVVDIVAHDADGQISARLHDVQFTVSRQLRERLAGAEASSVGA